MGKKRKGEESWQLDMREMAFAKRLLKPEQKKTEKEVQQQLTELPYKVKEWYPIYSDTVGGWQMDLMFLNTPVGTKGHYKEHALLCVININSKYAFVRELNYKNKNKDTAWRPREKQIFKVPSHAKNYKNVTTAMMNILKDMKAEQIFLRKEAPNANPHATFKVKVLYSDDGGEFKGAFKQWCTTKNIRQVLFKPLTGKKTRLGIVERFNRTFRRYYEVYLKTHPGTSTNLTVLIPEILKEYNREKDHKSIRRFWKRNFPKGKRLRGFGGSLTNPIKLVFTPMMMMLKGKQTDWIEYKKKQTEQVDDHYTKKIKQLQTLPTVRYWKKLIPHKKGSKSIVEGQELFAKSGKGTLTQPVQVLKQHSYVNKSQKTPFNQTGKSFVVGTNTDGALKLLPYDVVL